MNQVSVVIPNWNGKELLRICLDSLSRQTYKDFSVLVIDNASTDGSSEMIVSSYPSVSVHRMEENVGFASAVNEGIKASSAPYILLLNNDIECDEHFIEEMVRAIESDEKIFSVSAKMIRYRERELLDDCGDLYTVLGYQLQRGTGQPVTEKRYQKPAFVFSSCGGAALYRRDGFSRIGLFDPMHFAYLEDIDIGYRAQIYGYRNLYEPKAVVYHIGSASSGGTLYNDFKVRLSARNNQYVLYKNMPLFYRVLNALPLWIGRTVKKRFFRKKGFLDAYLDGLREARDNRPKLKRIPFQWSHLFSYIRIEHYLIVNTFIYVRDYLSRHK